MTAPRFGTGLAAAGALVFALSTATAGLTPTPPPAAHAAPAHRPAARPSGTGRLVVNDIGRIDGPVQALAWQGDVLWAGLGRTLTAFRFDGAGQASRIIPAAPVVLEADITRLMVDGDRLYAMAGWTALVIVDIARPDAPVLRERLPLLDASALLADDGRLYVGTWSQALRVYRVPANGNIVLESELTPAAVGGRPMVLARAGDGLLFGALVSDDGALNVVTIDVADPTRPRVRGRTEVVPYVLNEGASPIGLLHVGTTVHVFYHQQRTFQTSPDSQWTGEVLSRAAVGIADPDHPLTVAADDAELAAMRLKPMYSFTPGMEYSFGGASPGGAPWIAFGVRGIDSDGVHPPVHALFANFGDPDAPLYQLIDLPIAAGALAATPNALAVADVHGALYRVPIADGRPDAAPPPTIVERAAGVDVAGDIAVVAQSGAGVQVFDIRDVAAPRLLAVAATPGVAAGTAAGLASGAQAVVIAGHTAWVADGMGGLVAVDITDPTAPTVAAALPTLGPASAIEIEGTRAYVIDTAGIDIVDIASPAAPRELGRIWATDGLEGLTDVAVSGDRAWVVTGRRAVVAVDVSDPSAPAVEGSVTDDRDTGAEVAVAVDADARYAYLLTPSGHLRIVHAATRTDGLMVYLAGRVETYPVRVEPLTLAVDGGVAVVGYEHGNVAFADINGLTPDDGSPFPAIGVVMTPGEPTAIVRRGLRTFVAGLHGGVNVYLAAQSALLHNIFLPMTLGNAAVPEAEYIVGAGYFPVASPDGQWVVWSIGPALYRSSPGRFLGQEQYPGPLGTFEAEAIETPVFTPDGRRIYFAAKVLGHWDIWRVDLDGSGLTNITGPLFDAAADEQRPAVSPDGRVLAFDKRSETPAVESDVFLLDLASGIVTAVTNDPAIDRFPSFHPDGRQLVFRSTRDGNSELYTVGVEGSGLRRLTHDPSYDAYASFSPNGRQIVFQSNRDGPWGVYMLDVASGATSRVSEAGSETGHPRFAPGGRALVYYRMVTIVIPGIPYSNDMPEVTWKPLPKKLAAAASDP